MTYTEFSTLYRKALEAESLESFCSDCEESSSDLSEIYNLAISDFETNRKKITTNRSEFSRLYNIPNRTLQDWELGKRTMPHYLKELIDYTIFKTEKENEK